MLLMRLIILKLHSGEPVLHNNKPIVTIYHAIVNSNHSV